MQNHVSKKRGPELGFKPKTPVKFKSDHGAWPRPQGRPETVPDVGPVEEPGPLDDVRLDARHALPDEDGRVASSGHGQGKGEAKVEVVAPVGPVQLATKDVAHHVAEAEHPVQDAHPGRPEMQRIW